MCARNPRVRVLLLVSFLGLVGVLLFGCARLLLDVAGFNVSPCSGSSPLEVHFAPAVDGNVRSWWWSFGDGQGSVEQSPNHKYEQPGTYTVILSVVPHIGQPVTIIKEDIITVRRAGFMAPRDQLVVEDDVINLYYAPHDSDRNTYSLDVLANDYSTAASAELQITGLRKEGEETHSLCFWHSTGEDDTEIRVTCANDGKGIDIRVYWEGCDSWDSIDLPVFFYEAADGVRTFEGRVDLFWEWPPFHHTILN